MAKAKQNELQHFKVDMSKFADVATYVVSIIKVRDEGHDCGAVSYTHLTLPTKRIV